MFSIETGTLRLQLEVAPVKALCHHEEIIPEAARKLVLEFRNWANLQNPIIVDENHIVLDGNHRLFAFRKLNFKHIPVCKIDYFNESARLRYWFRLLGRVDNLASVTKTLSDMGGSIRQLKDREALRETLEKDSFCCGIQQGDFFAFISFPEDIVYDAVSAYNALEELQSRLIGTGIEVEYIPCQPVCDGDFCDAPDRGEVVLWTPRITKEMVVAAAKDEKVFAPKATRHLIPARPLNVNVPIHWFKEDVSLEDINDRFNKFLQGKHLKRFGPGQVINGRYYEEELFVFFDKRH
jgi:L-serine kinase (ADP)